MNNTNTFKITRYGKLERFMTYAPVVKHNMKRLVKSTGNFIVETVEAIDRERGLV